jgi:hypothetical protein
VAEKFTLDQWTGKPLYLAMILAQLGKSAQAGEYLEQLKTLEPGFRTDPYAYIHRYFPRKKDARQIISGLKLAGLDAEAT